MTPAERAARRQKDDAVIMLLAKLAPFYWRPDMSVGQTRDVYEQYLEDLRDYPMESIVEAIQKYRKDGDSKFFPTSGQLVGIIETVPAWDVISKQRHIGDLKQAARAEMQAAAAQIENQQHGALTGPKP